ncbi:MAG TPA: DMT family transporter, partial [Egibacteraceae bacterium]|nr:DMT family transporter [Egibacteraceae bacterium]
QPFLRATAVVLHERPLVAGAAGALVIAFSAILVRLADVSPSTAAVYRCAYAVPPLAALAWWERRRYGPRSGRDRRLALLAGLFFAADLVAWHHAIDAVGAGLATVLANTQVAMVGLAAWAFLGERPHRKTIAAVPVVLFGVVLISGVLGEGAYGRAPALGAVLGLATALFYAAFLLILRRGNSDLRRPAGPLLDATIMGALGSLVAGAALGELHLAPTWPAHGWLLVLALTSQVVAWLLISVSLPRLPAVTTSVVLTLQPVGSVLLGMVLLAEAPSPLQLVGVAVVVAGIVLATLGRRPRSRRQEPMLDPAPAG